MRHIIAFSVFVILTVPCHSASYLALEVDLQNPDTILYDRFIDNRNNWRAPYSKVKKGRLIVESLMKDPVCFSTIPVEIDMSRDFEIRAKFSWNWNRSKDFMGFVWGRGLDNGYFIGFNKLHELKIWEKRFGVDVPIFLMVAPEVVYAEFEVMELAIKKVASEYIVFMNGIEIQRLPVVSDAGNQLGFFSGEQSEIRAHELVVFYTS